MTLPIPKGLERKSFAAAISLIANKRFLESKKHEAQQWRADREGMHPDLRAFERAFIRRMKRLDVPMFGHCVMRSLAGQQFVYNAGTSKAAPGQSPHQYGKAIDIVHGVQAWDIPRASWIAIGHIGKEVAQQLGVKVRWGGDFQSLWDPAHWELHPWRDYPSATTVEKHKLEDLLAYYSGEESVTAFGCSS